MLKRSADEIKVLHIVGSMNAGGLETFIMNIYRNIDNTKVQFDFLVQTKEEGFYDAEIRKLGGRIISLSKPKDGINRYKKELNKIIKEFGPYDAIHSHVLFFSGVTLSVAKKNNIPVRIAHSHNTSDSRIDSIYRKIYRYIMRKKILSNATHLLGCSKEACEYVFGAKTLEKGLTRHFPNAIEIGRYKNLIKDKSYLIEELGLRNNSTLIGHIGRFTKQKNHSFIIDVFEAYLKKNKNAELILVGEGEEQQKIKHKVSTKGIENKVHFLNLRKDIPKILASIDLFFFPSLYEGLGIVLIEAQAARVPCLISDVIPLEADLNMGLINRLSLSNDIHHWVNAIDKTVKSKIPSWDKIKIALELRGYEIKSSSITLLDIYMKKT